MADDITRELIERYKKVSAATVYSGVRRLGYEPCFMRGVKNFTPGRTLVGRARTLRFIPPRPDIIAETHRGESSPEYEAMGSCEPGDVLVCDGMGRVYAAIRDLDIVQGYGLTVFAGDRTPMGGADEIEPYEANVTIACGGVAVRPGDLIVGDDDGVVVVPAGAASEVIDWVEEHEEVEEYIKGLIQEENVSPGKYYPPTDAMVEQYRRSRGG